MKNSDFKIWTDYDVEWFTYIPFWSISSTMALRAVIKTRGMFIGRRGDEIFFLNVFEFRICFNVYSWQ